MLDERQVLVCELMAKGLKTVDVAKESGVARSTIYEWKKLEEFTAELDKLGQEFIIAARKRVQHAAPEAADMIISLMKTGKYEKTRLAAAFDILDRDLGKATTKIDIADGRNNKDSVSTDVLDNEMDEFEND